MKRNNLHIKNIDKLSPKDLDEKIAILANQKLLNLDKAISSNDPAAIFKAQSYLKSLQSGNQQKAYLFDPFSQFMDGSGYKRKTHKVGYEILKRVAKIPIIKTVHNTRTFQVQNYLKFQTDESKEGYTIRKKNSLFDDETKELTTEDKRKIEYIVEFIQNSRRPSKKNKSSINFDPAKWDRYDDLDDFIRLIINDTYSFDQIAVENIRSRRFELLAYQPVDSSTIRYLDTIDDRFKDSSVYSTDEVNGFLPRYGQVWNGEILKNEVTAEPIVWYPWEMSFAIRNTSTDVHSNFYGTSELEVLTDVITYFLYGFQYNGNFFKNGSNPKGFINIKDGGGGSGAMEDFKDTWRSLVSGAGNENKIPMFEGMDIEWVKMQETNKDMEFQQWMEFLISMVCSVYCIDPTELGFNFQKSASTFGQDGQKERLNHSKEKGLKPMLMFLQKFMTKYIVSEIDPEFEFIFTGIDLEDEETIIKNDKLKSEAGFVSMEDMFEKYSGRKITDKDTILNTVAFQYKSQLNFGGEEENAMVDEESGGEDVGVQNPFAAFEKEAESNPIVKSSMDYINKNIR